MMVPRGTSLRIFAGVLVGCLVLTVTLAAVARAAPVTAIITGKVGGVVPILGNLEMNVQVHALGSSSSSLEGKGVEEAFAFGVFIERSELEFDSGSTDGTTVSLSGHVANSLAPGLIGSPVSLAATAPGAISITFGPIVGGPFAGQTHTFVGSGNVVINGV